MALKFRFCCLRAKCFIIAYLNLLAVVVDIVCHVMVVAIVTRGFQCDVDEHSIRQVDLPWLEPLLVIINVGTHGFYPFPLVAQSHSQKNYFLEYLRPAIATTPTCYPGMVHVYLVDILNFTINLMWFNFVKSYVVAVHKKDYHKMNVFFIVSLVKIVLQFIYFGYQPDINIFGVNRTFWSIKVIDLCIAVSSLIIIHAYIKELKDKARQAAARRLDRPPPYIECLIAATHPVKRVDSSSKVEKEPVVSDEVEKIDIEVITVTQHTTQPVDGASQS